MSAVERLIPWADIKATRRAAVIAGLQPPPLLSLSQWADLNYWLSAETSAEAGRWTCLPYQVGIMDSITDPTVTYVSVMKSARVGYTLMASAAIGYFIDQAPCSQLLVQPTVDDAKSYSKDTIAPMIRDVPVLAARVIDEAEDSGARDSGNTIQAKRYPGGTLSLVGANSGAGFRRRSCKVVIFDEVDAYPPSAGSDGDPIKLGTKRSEYFWDRKILAGSTPLVAGRSRIEALYLAGDQRRYYVPCPHCGHMDYLVFTERESGGHSMKWPEGQPEKAFFMCSLNGCAIEHKDKREIVARGEWRASKPFVDHASFHIWSAYSFSPNATWGHIAREFLEAKHGGRETLRVFTNTVLGETFKESGEAPDWERLYLRREGYQIGTVPAGVKILTCGVDVQKDRVVYEVVGWAGGRESWSIEAGVIPMDTANDAEWIKLDGLLGRSFPVEGGLPMGISRLAIDSGYNTQQVYNWARRHGLSRVIAVKGVSTARTLLQGATKVDVTLNGQRAARGASVWPVGVDIAKAELYGWLRLEPPKIAGAAFPPGFCHYPEHGEDWFKQVTAEHLVTTVSRKGFSVHEWQLIPGRENHYLDARIYARAAAAACGIDRFQRAAAPVVTPAKRDDSGTVVAHALEPRPAPPAPPRTAPAPGFLGTRPGWLTRRR